MNKEQNVWMVGIDQSGFRKPPEEDWAKPRAYPSDVHFVEGNVPAATHVTFYCEHVDEPQGGTPGSSRWQVRVSPFDGAETWKKGLEWLDKSRPRNVLDPLAQLLGLAIPSRGVVLKLCYYRRNISLSPSADEGATPDKIDVLVDVSDAHALQEEAIRKNHDERRRLGQENLAIAAERTKIELVRSQLLEGHEEHRLWREQRVGWLLNMGVTPVDTWWGKGREKYLAEKAAFEKVERGELPELPELQRIPPPLNRVLIPWANDDTAKRIERAGATLFDPFMRSMHSAIWGNNLERAKLLQRSGGGFVVATVMASAVDPHEAIIVRDGPGSKGRAQSWKPPGQR